MGKVDWDKHFKNYDLFQNNYFRYLAAINFCMNELRDYEKIIDTGAGSGNLTIRLLKRGHTVTAVDFNGFALKILREKCLPYSDNLKILKEDINKINFKKEGFDGASSVFVVPFVKDIENYFSKVYSSLKKGGKFVLLAWAPIEGLVDLALKEVQEIDAVKEYKNELMEIIETSRQASRVVIDGPNQEEIITSLKNVGFKKIKTYKKNPYGKYAYFITCVK